MSGLIPIAGRLRVFEKWASLYCQSFLTIEAAPSCRQELLVLESSHNRNTRDLGQAEAVGWVAAGDAFSEKKLAGVPEISRFAGGYGCDPRLALRLTVCWMITGEGARIVKLSWRVW
jgi:hypothetical protein